LDKGYLEGTYDPPLFLKLLLEPERYELLELPERLLSLPERLLPLSLPLLPLVTS
jgi:hypothetical protein